MIFKPMTKPVFKTALNILKKQDPDIARILSKLGPPEWRKRQYGFPTLVRIILEQQVSLASGQGVFNRLKQSVTQLTPGSFLGLNAEHLRQIGFSRQKTRYCTILAEEIKKKSLRLDDLGDIPDKEVQKELTKITGIGRWTADIYLMEALKRPDIWPAGDLALAIAVQQILKLKERPKPEQLDQIGEKWKPWRSVAARVFWHYYLNNDST